MVWARLNRKASHRVAMLRTMVTQLIKHERIETTFPKAKALQKMADRMVALGKKGTLHHRRQAQAYIRDPETVSKLFTVLAPRYQFREGGFTRTLRTRYRKKDAALMAYIEFVDREGELKPANPVGNKVQMTNVDAPVDETIPLAESVDP